MPILVNGQIVSEAQIREEMGRLSAIPAWRRIPDEGERERNLRSAAEAVATDRILIAQLADLDPRPVDDAELDRYLKESHGAPAPVPDGPRREAARRGFRYQRFVEELVADTVPPELGQMEALGVSSADSHFPLRVEGVVTFYDPVNRLLFIQDETGGAFINFTRPFPIVKGSRVLVTGVTEADFTNTINQPSIRELGRGPLPKPHPVPFRDITGGREDCNLVSLTGIVRRASFETNHVDAKHDQRVLVIRLATLDGEIEAHLIDFGKLTPAGLIDSTIRIAAVVGADYNDQSQFVQAIVMIPDWREVEVLRWGEKNFSAVPLLPIRKRPVEATWTK